MRLSGLPRFSALLAIAALVVACDSAMPSRVLPSPIAITSLTAAGRSAAAGAAWIAARVEQPASIEAAPTDAPVFCSPCHPSVGTYIDSLVAVRGGYLAFGFDQPPSHAALWSSTDAATWRRVAGLPAPERSSIAAAVAGPEGTVVAVGASGGVAAVWSSADGAAWTLTSLPGPGSGATETLTAVAATGRGYVAGGYVESAAAVRTASLWRSTDGAAWTRATVETSTGPTEVTGIAVDSATATLVAVGIAGDERRGAAAVWRSTDGGGTWLSVASPAFAIGRMLAVASGMPGLVAVGELQDQTGAAAWFSADGSTWVAADRSGLDNGGLQMVMTAVARTGSSFVAAGWRTDSANGSAVVWRSSDGRTWVHLPQQATFSGAGLSSVLGSPMLMVAGTMGWPDTHAAQVWTASGG